MSVTYELTRCVVCGSQEARELASAEAMTKEVEALWAFHTRRLRPETPPPHLMDRVAFSQHAPLRVVRCPVCGLVYRNPAERATELEEIYEESGPAAEVMRSLHAAQRASYAAQARRLTRIFGRRGTGIEVGSYVGAFLAAARDAGWQFTGVDVNRCANDFTRSLGYRVDDGSLESLDPDRRADVIAIWNCLDQLADPAAALRAAHSRLDAGGLIAVRVPNGACYAVLRPLLSTPAAPFAREWLAQNNLLAFPYRFGFTPRALTRLVEQLGFRVEHVVGDALVPIADRWTRPWAALEERVVKRVVWLTARLARGDRAPAPWFELYARRR